MFLCHNADRIRTCGVFHENGAAHYAYLGKLEEGYVQLRTNEGGSRQIILEYFFTMEKLVQAQYNIGHKMSSFKTSLRE